MFSTNEGSCNIIQTTKFDSLLVEVSKAITKTSKKKSNRQPKVQISDGSEREPHLLNMAQHDDRAEPLPLYTNYWLSQTDPSYVAQEEYDSTDTEIRRKSTHHPAGGIKDYLGNWMTPEDIKSVAFQERFPNCISERPTMYGVPLSMGATNSSLSKMGIGMTDSGYVVASNSTKRKMEKALRMRWQGQIL